MMNLDCYENIVGLCRGANPCNATPPEGFDESKSGLYLCDFLPYEYLGPDCEAAWATYDDARRFGVSSFISDIDAQLITYNKPKRQTFSGGIGQTTGRGSLAPKARFHGIRIFGAGIRGGAFNLQKIGVLFDASGEVNLILVDNENTQIWSGSINAVANKHTQIEVDLSLSLSDGFGGNSEYYLYYEYPEFGSPKTNEIDCGCGGRQRVVFNCDAPYCFSGRHSGAMGWANWVMVGEWNGESEPNFSECPSRASNEMNGITMYGTFDCAVNEVVCSEKMNMNNPVAAMVAHAIYRRALMKLSDIILSQIRPTQQAQIARQNIIENKAVWSSEYSDVLRQIFESVQIGANDCLKCRSFIEIQQKGILT